MKEPSELDQESLDSIHSIREEWKARQPDPTCLADVIELVKCWRASPEAAECERRTAEAMGREEVGG